MTHALRFVGAAALALLLGGVVAPVPDADASMRLQTRAAGVCSYHVVHITTRLRVHERPYVDAPVVGHLYPHVRVRGGCDALWGVDRYWVQVNAPVDGYADAHYLDKV